MSESGTLGWDHYPGRMSQPFVTWQREYFVVFRLGVFKQAVAFHTLVTPFSVDCLLLSTLFVFVIPHPLFLGCPMLLPVPDNRSFMSWVHNYIWLMQTPAFSAGHGRPHQCQRKVDCKYWQEDSTRPPTTLSESDWSGGGLGMDWRAGTEGDGERGPAFSSGNWVCFDAQWQGTHCLPREHEGEQTRTHGLFTLPPHAFLKCQNAHSHSCVHAGEVQHPDAGSVTAGWTEIQLQESADDRKWAAGLEQQQL